MDEGALLQLPLEELIKRMDDRQRRLFACDCTERMLRYLEARYPVDPCIQEAIDTARCFANGDATKYELASSYRLVWSALIAFEESLENRRSSEHHPIVYLFDSTIFTIAAYNWEEKTREDYRGYIVYLGSNMGATAVKYVTTWGLEVKRYYAKSDQEAEKIVEAELNWKKQRAVWYLTNRGAGTPDKDID